MTNNEIKKYWWKFGEGYEIGAVIDFDRLELEGDTIFSYNKPIAIILSCGKGIFRKTAVLEVKDLETGKVGVYHQKSR